ncbi:uncharacterized protein TRAVEDRAFT_50720 [Trametes versicolor FP-101664 SS1]|uniref:uncharacterized protein n=1 Tax=Trametes versicolor (strain FP-101664) TaxID=717944 RepID=UPI0004622C00|nr:uncharacterized protein TRAVEDRAFT_50720 [Trametes versicolor FP-101664 SS1]EIW56239.1 hypothetical protein TRAVEDRAFT_50720 [Trametes versicolor FP-101664 SS1]
MAKGANPTTPRPGAGEVPVTFERHPDFYFDDGDIVLQAELPSSPERCTFQLYCVHTTILRFHSDFFSNLFADAYPGQEQSFEGLPLVHMSDKPEDIVSLLSYVYNPSEYLLRPCHSDTPLELHGAVRLASKYVMDEVRLAIIKRVTMNWPISLDDWDLREGVNAVFNRLIRQRGRHIAANAWADRALEPMGAIVFAQEHGCTEILPAAFYMLASIDIDNDWDSTGTGAQEYTEPPRGARWSLCNRDNLVRWVKGRKALETYHTSIEIALTDGEMLREDCIPWWTRNFPDPWDEPSVDRDMYPCLHLLWTLRDVVWGKKLANYDLLGQLSKLNTHDLDPHTANKIKKICPETFCFGCQHNFDNWLDEKRHKLWTSLSGFFDLKK